MFTPWAKNLVMHSTPSAGDRVLDIACGTGLVTQQIAPHLGKDGSIVGLDFAPGMLAVAQKLKVSGPQVEWVEASAQESPLPDDSFDRAYCQQGFQFFPDRAGAASEVKRVLKPGGSLAISLWASIDEHPLWNALFTTVATRLNVPIEAVAKPTSFGDADEIRSMLNAAGFSNVEVNKRSDLTTFPDVDSFMKLTVQGAAAAIPAFGELTDEERVDLAAGVEADTVDEVKKYTIGTDVVMPTISYTALATA